MTTIHTPEITAVQEPVEQVLLKRYRFMQPTEDYRPISWPIPWPYWCSGSAFGANDETINILIAYAPDDEYIKKYWPEAYELDGCNEDLKPEDILFSSRFQRPDWYTGPGCDLQEKPVEAESNQIYIGD